MYSLLEDPAVVAQGENFLITEAPILKFGQLFYQTDSPREAG